MQTKKIPPSEADLIDEVMQNLRRMFKAVESYSRSVEERFGLTGPQLWALWELGRDGPLALKDLASRMHLSPSTVVGVVDRLIAKGLVLREQDTQDRRRVCLYLSQEGRALWTSAPNPAQGKLVEGLQSMDPSQRRELNRSLEFLVKVMEADKIEAKFFFSEE